MKKYLIIIIMFFSIILLSACSKAPTISFENEEVNIFVGDEYNLIVEVSNSSSDVIYSTPENSFISIEGNKVKAISVGSATVTAKIVEKNKTYTTNLKINVLPIPVNNILINGKDIMVVGKETQTLSYIISPENAGSKKVNWTSSDNSLATVDELGCVTALKAGKVTITATSDITLSCKASIEITIIEEDTTKPVITDNIGNVTLNIGEEINVLNGISALDDIDGDITNKIEVTSNINKYKAGVYEVKYNVKDENNNEALEVSRTYTLVYNSYVEFIGHAGSYYGIMNTEEAFINAGKRGYQLCECDLKQTSDGVFVLCHDDTFASKTIASTTYANLKDVTTTLTRGGISYTSKICTLARYLEICKEYNMKALIELKSSNGITNSSQARMAALMQEISKADMLHDVVFLGSQYNCLIWVKQNGYDYIPCQYLVNSCESETVLERCNTYDLDLSFNIENSNSNEWLARYVDAGHKVSCWTFSQYSTKETLQKWIDTGYVDYVTCDVLTCLDVVLPTKKNYEEKPKYKVEFRDYDDTLIKTSYAIEGYNAVSPVDPTRNGYTFAGWDTDYNKVSSDLVVKATYNINTYTISYYPNNSKITEKTFTSKQEFVNEFYTDYFNWLKDNVDNISELSFDGSKYTISKNGVTVTFTSVDDIKAEDIYNFEKTYSNFIYKPVKRSTNTTKVTPEEDELYFLNSSKYRTKWINMDEYFLNACINGYSSYDRTYTPTSAGKIQIMFRFQQWQKGTNIPAFDKLPTIYIESSSEFEVELPTTNITYTIVDEIILDKPVAAGKTFKGWNTKADGSGEMITKINKGTTGNLSLYAIWE